MVLGDVSYDNNYSFDADLNNAKVDGALMIWGAHNNAHAPIQGESFIILVRECGMNYKTVQIAFGLTSAGYIGYRIFSDNAWTEWKSVTIGQ